MWSFTIKNTLNSVSTIKLTTKVYLTIVYHNFKTKKLNNIEIKSLQCFIE